MSSNLRSQLSKETGVDIDTDFSSFPILSGQQILSLAKDFSIKGARFSFLLWLRCLWAIFDFKRLRAYLRQTSSFLVLPEGYGSDALRAITQKATILEKMLYLAKFRQQTLPLEAPSKSKRSILTRSSTPRKSSPSPRGMVTARGLAPLFAKPTAWR